MFNLLENDARQVLSHVDLGYFEGKSVLITGASGLIGINLLSVFKLYMKITGCNINCKALIKSEPESYFIDLCNKYIDWRCFDLANNDISNSLDSYDVIIHLATYGQPSKFINDKLSTIKLNTGVVINLFHLLKPKGKFLYLSSSEVYSGLEGMHSEDEIGTTDYSHPRACYIESKKFGETICKLYKDMDIDVKVVRLGLGYGMGVKSNDNRVLNELIMQGLMCAEISLRDKGEALRSYIYITDVVESMLNILLFGKEFIYNIGGNETISIKQLAELIGDKLNKPVKIPTSTTEDYQTGSPKCVLLYTAKYLDEFYGRELIKINDGIDKVIEWYSTMFHGGF